MGEDPLLCLSYLTATQSNILRPHASYDKGVAEPLGVHAQIVGPNPPSCVRKSPTPPAAPPIMSEMAIAHIRRVAPPSVSDDAIRAMLRDTAKDPGRVRARLPPLPAVVGVGTGLAMLDRMTRPTTK